MKTLRHRRMIGNVVGVALALWLCASGNLFAQQSNTPAAKALPEEFTALRLAIEDLTRSFGEKYPKGPQYLQRLNVLRQQWSRAAGEGDNNDPAAQEAARKKTSGAVRALAREALLANPLLDFERLLLLKRGVKSPALGLPRNWQGNSSLPAGGFDDEIVLLDLRHPEGKLTTLFKPVGGRFVGDLDLHFDADRLLFSSTGAGNQWHVFEIRTDGSGLRQVTHFEDQSVDNYDACYLPSGDIIFSSTIGLKGVPCVRGSDHVANLFRCDRDGNNVRQLTFDQDHDWCPTVLPNGRVLYLRWEYSDLPHFVARILFHMNPDGTEQRAYYGSNSYWPNSMFYARPIPGHPSQFVTVISGHHDVARMGELLLFDVAKGDHEAGGAVQRIPGRGKKVEPILRDGLVGPSWPKFLHPQPLSDKYFIVSAKLNSSAKWGIYLVDVFDNMTLIKELDGFALLEPIPLRKTPKPPVIRSRVKPGEKEASVYIANIYAGPGLKGIPTGTVKKLRLFTYHFAYHGMGGQTDRVGLDGPWDVKRIIGTVPVKSDGSALFQIPANTPISVQPLDDEGKALQLMRSWFVGMPGETVSCTGCHERSHATPPPRETIALSKPSRKVTPWYGPTRGFSFTREVQPVLDEYCIGCHNGEKRAGGNTLANLRLQAPIHPHAGNSSYNNNASFTPSYFELRRFVHTPTMESDMHMLTPGEFHADTSRLVQMLQSGHHGVKLDREAWDRLITWIDLNAPAHGTWHEIVGDARVGLQRDRRREMLRRYANRDEDPEAIVLSSQPAARTIMPKPLVKRPEETIDIAGWPFGAAEAQRRQQAAGKHRQTISLGPEINLTLVRIPAGEFVMGDPHGQTGQPAPRRAVIEKPFWMGQFEITNEQFRQFSAEHDSRLEVGDFLQFSQQERGYAVNGPRQPVVRVSWREATEFCRWLSKRTGKNFGLPDETQWEYACRAGTASALSYGGPDDDFSAYANLADATLRTVSTYPPFTLPSGAIPDWRPACDRFNDRARVSAVVGSYRPNAWGLYDMHGNVAEWTANHDERSAGDRRAVRGGSWYDRPKDSRSASRVSYRSWQKVYDVGFRVVCETTPAK